MENDQEVGRQVRVYAVDDRGLFCRHCGRTTWLHSFVRGVGYVCDTHLLANTGDA